MKLQVALSTLLLISSLNPLSALVVRDDTDPDNDRFSSGYPDNPQPNSSFFADSFDFSGVGWDTSDSRRSVALISPRHFVAANHFAPSIGQDIDFYNASGSLETLSVDSLINVKNDSNENTDLVVGRLSSTASSELSIYPIIPTESDTTTGQTNQYGGRQLYVYGAEAKVGIGEVSGFSDTSIENINSTRTAEFEYNTNNGDPDEVHFESGDSGSPSFFVENNSLALAATHLAVSEEFANTITNFDTFTAHYEDEINAILADDGYTLAVVPEPRITALAILGSIFIFTLRRRRRSVVNTPPHN